MDLCELLPLQAKIMDKMAILRGIKFDAGPGQPHGMLELITGFNPFQPRRPAFGSVVSKKCAAWLRECRPMSASPSVATRKIRYTWARRIGRTWAAARTSAWRGMTLERLHDRKALLGSFDAIHRDLDGKGDMAGMDDITKQALEIVSSRKVRDAFDLNREPLPIRERYGKATSFLLARRLVEAGVSIVTLSQGGAYGMGTGWDGHYQNFQTHRDLRRSSTRASLPW